MNRIIYPKVESVTPAVISKVTDSKESLNKSTDESVDCNEYDTNDDNNDDEYYDKNVNDKKPKFFDQAGLDDFIRDLNLSKDKAELCASRLKERNLLLSGTKVTVQDYKIAVYKILLDRKRSCLL